MATKKKPAPKKSAPKKKAATKKAPKVVAIKKKVGVLDHIEAMFSRKDGVTFKEGAAELATKFPQRVPEKLAVTMRCQITKLPQSRKFTLNRELREGRGLVYWKTAAEASKAASA